MTKTGAPSTPCTAPDYRPYRWLHPQIKKKVRSALERMLSNPLCGKALKDELDGLRSFRVGRFRIVYRIAAGRVVELVAIGSRERIYEETYRLITKKPTLPGP
ncbi:MAG: type II toxin-antitoxin system RelE/ParE family toxin [Pseudomonadota bacterium]|nr:type II toxin-antitoxin system RelE/ParE family toxin [Pseudomonadota bacterium]